MRRCVHARRDRHAGLRPAFGQRSFWLISEDLGCVSAGSSGVPTITGRKPRTGQSTRILKDALGYGRAGIPNLEQS